MNDALEEALNEIKKLRMLIAHDVYMFEQLLKREYKKKYLNEDLINTFAVENTKRYWLECHLELMESAVETMSTVRIAYTFVDSRPNLNSVRPRAKTTTRSWNFSNQTTAGRSCASPIKASQNS